MPREMRLGAELDKLRHMLDMISFSTSLPIGLAERGNGGDEVYISTIAGEHFEPYCNMIREFERGYQLCEADHRRRASATQTHDLTLCHAGLYNCAVPIVVEGQVVASLLFGQMRIKGDEQRKRRSWQKVREVARDLGLDAEQKRRLEKLFHRTKVLSVAEVERIRDDIRTLVEWYYELVREKQLLAENIEKVTHELQIRLQAVFAYTENLYTDLCAAPNMRRDLKDTARDLLHTLEGLDVVVQNLGEFLETYRFTPKPIGPIVHNSANLYEAEARRKGVTISVDLELVDGRSPTLEISEPHLQHAMHNLVQNAVKYSFRGAYDRRRTVDIRGRCAGRYYSIAIENYGVGIDPDEYESIFQDGYQGRHTEGEYRTGSGKGLYFVRKVIEQHQGRIEVSSTDKKSGHLNRFTIYLPYTQKKDGDEKS